MLLKNNLINIFLLLFLFNFNCVYVVGDNFYLPDVEETEKLTIDEWFNKLDEQMLILNRYTANVAWEMSVKPTEKLNEQSIKLSMIKTKWHNKRCKEIEEILLNNNLARDRERMIYLLCRGPKFTEYQASELSKVLSKMQEIYAETSVCLPKHFDLCLNIDHIWNFTYVQEMSDSDELLILDLSSVSPKRDQYITNLNYYDKIQILNPDYYIYHTENTNDNQENQLIDRRIRNNGEFSCFNGEPDLERIMYGNFDSFDRNDCMLNSKEIFNWAWEAWRFAVGPPIASIYPEAIYLMNIGAINNGYNDIGETWREELEMPNLKKTMDNLMESIKPFYNLLHGVLRHLLTKKFPNENIKADGLLPAHLLGNMWSQNWGIYQDLILPVKDVSLIKQLNKTNWTTIDMVKRADDFYSSLGLDPVSNKFWQYSIFEKFNENDTEKCHGTAANMFEENDYRMIMCGDRTLEDFYVIHHELGHIHYYMLYKYQPTLFQDGTNTAMQESIGDAIYLGVMTPNHLNRLNLLPDNLLYPDIKKYENDNILTNLYIKNLYNTDNNAKNKINLNKMLSDNDITPFIMNRIKKLQFLEQPYPNITEMNKNFNDYQSNFNGKHNHYDLTILLQMALTKIPQIPYQYILDIFRWNMFNGNVNINEANNYYWDMTKKYQGIKPPKYGKERSQLFDAAAKFHIPDNTPYVRYFLASFIHAQIFRGLCYVTIYDTVNINNKKLNMPLHRCDIYGSKRAGNLLKKALSLGASAHWTEVLYILTGSKEINADALLEYYQPLIDFLEHLVNEYNIPVGW